VETFAAESNTLVRISKPKGDQIPDRLDFGQLDEIISAYELPDGSWELPVRVSYFPKFEFEVRNRFSGCKIERNYHPMEPTPEEVEQLGLRMAKHKTISTFSSRAHRLTKDAWPLASTSTLACSPCMRGKSTVCKRMAGLATG